MIRGCGSCNFCCEFIGVPDIGRPKGMRCWNTTVHGGCTRQAEKLTSSDMQACAQFECVWLQSQSRPKEEWIRHARPDISHVMFGPPDPDDDMRLFVHVHPGHPTAWKKEPVSTYLAEMAEKGIKIRVYVGEMTIEGDALGLG